MVDPLPPEPTDAAGWVGEQGTLPRVSIVLPTYNERGTIEQLIHQLLGLSPSLDLEILVVDDDSADGTAELVRALAHRMSQEIGRAHV